MATYTSGIRQFSGDTFQIKEVYPAYRAGGVELPDGKFQFRTFKYFPVDERESVFSGDPEILAKASADATPKMELREQKWNDVEKKFEFIRVKGKLDGDFFKTYKKVYDVSIRLDGVKKIHRYKEVYEENDEVVLQGVSASKLKDILRNVADVNPPMVNGKDKAGNPAMVEAFDWEENYRANAKGLFVKMKVAGEGLDTKYSFLPGREFAVMEEELPAPKKQRELPQDSIDIADIPF